MSIIVCYNCNSTVVAPKATGVAFCKCKHCAVHRIGDTVTVDAPGTDFFKVLDSLPEPVQNSTKPAPIKKGNAK